MAAIFYLSQCTSYAVLSLGAFSEWVVEELGPWFLLRPYAASRVGSDSRSSLRPNQVDEADVCFDSGLDTGFGSMSFTKLQIGSGGAA